MNEIDAKILKELLKDGRKSFAEIAEQCGTSKDVVTKRYKKMKQEGIIVGATIQMNYRFFGYYAVANLTIQVDPQGRDKVAENLGKMPNIFSVIRSYNKRKIIAVATLRNLGELDFVKDTIRKQHSVHEIRTHLWTSILNIHENLNIEQPHRVTNREDEKNFPKIDEATKKVDTIDNQIIEKLSKNGRLPFTKIAKEVKTSTDTIIRRYERLKQLKAVKVIIQIDPKKIGYQAVAIFNVALMSQSDVTETVKRTSEIPDVVHIVKTSGEYDLEIMAFVRTLDHFFTIRDEIAKIPYTNIVDAQVEPIFRVSPAPGTYISTSK